MSRTQKILILLAIMLGLTAVLAIIISVVSN